MFPDTEHVPVNLTEKEYDCRVGSHPEVVSGQASPEPSETFLGEGLLETVGHTGVREHARSIRPLFLHFSLNVVGWQ